MRSANTRSGEQEGHAEKNEMALLVVLLNRDHLRT